MAEALTISAATSAEETIATPEGCIAVHSLLLLESSCKSSPLPMAHGRESVSDALTAEIRKDSEPQAAPSSRVPETANAPETRCGFGPMRESSLQSGVATLASPRFVSEAAWRRESITPKMLKDNFHLPLHTVAKKFGMCTTAFKKLCRRFSVPKWPHRQVELLPALSAGTHLRVLTQLCGAWQLRGVDKKIAAIRAELAYAPGADKSHLEADLAELCEEKARLLRGVLGARQESVSGSASSEEEVDATPPPSAANGAPDEKGASDEDSGSGEDDGPAHQRSDAGAPAFFGRSELVTEQELRDHFHLPLHTVAKKFGMCTTAFKKMCRRFSIAKWPHRQLRGIDKKIAALRAELNYSTGDKDTCRRSLASLEGDKAKLMLLPSVANTNGGVVPRDSSCGDAPPHGSEEGGSSDRMGIQNLLCGEDDDDADKEDECGNDTPPFVPMGSDKMVSRLGQIPSGAITEETLRENFHLPLQDVAKKFGMCTTAFKKMCRRFSIAKWPHRQLRGIDKKIAALRAELNYSTGDKDTCRQSLAALEEEKARLSSVALGHEAGSPTHAPASPSGGASEGACRTARKFSDDHSEPPSFGARARALSGLDVLAQVAGIDAPLEPLERESTCLSTASTAIEAAPPSPVAASESAPPAAARSAHKAFSLRGADGARTEDESPAERAQPLSPLLHGIKLEGFAQLRAFPPPAGLAVLSQLPLLRLSTAAAMPPASAGLPGGLIPRFNAAQ